MKRKKYETRQEIVSAIEKAQAAHKRLSERIEEHSKVATEYFQEAAKQNDAYKTGALIQEAEYNRLMERKLVERKGQVYPQKLLSLKRTLAAFDTEVLPFETSRSVVRQ